MKDLKAQIERSLNAKLKAFGREDKAEDRRMIESHEARLHGVKHRAAGGAIEGGMAKPRMDRKGGKKKDNKKGSTTVNIVVANKDPSPPPGAGLGELPPMPKPPAPPPAMAPPPMPPMPPPGMGPGGPGGPGGPPMMRANGGRVSEQDEMSAAGVAAGNKLAGRQKTPAPKNYSLELPPTKASMTMQERNVTQRAAGGRLGMTAGAASGEGRLEKEAVQKRKG